MVAPWQAGCPSCKTVTFCNESLECLLKSPKRDFGTESKGCCNFTTVLSAEAAAVTTISCACQSLIHSILTAFPYGFWIFDLCRRIVGSCTLYLVCICNKFYFLLKKILNIQTGHWALWPWPFEFVTCSYLESYKHYNEPTSLFSGMHFLKRKLSNTYACACAC